ncbi:hypothetical protein FB451DRAFT_1396386 [Mycena latifolia]|nr:hypothetical protein FB451DRAFT_1396386 [Mycena latifolia]
MRIHSLRRLRTNTTSLRCGFSVSLPLEIEFRIIDEFEGDTLRLRLLCRICRAWAAHAQPLFFRTVTVRTSTTEGFLGLLNNSSVTQHISALNIVKESYWQSDYAKRPDVLDALAPLLPAAFPNLRALDISNRVFQRAEALPEERWGAISRLQLRFCRFATSDTLLLFLAAFSRLECLDVFQCHILGAVAPPSDIPQPAWRLTYLALGEFLYTPLVAWLAAAPTDLAVAHLRILSLGPDASAFNALLAKIGAGLRRLEVPGMNCWRQGPKVPLSLRRCTALVALTFSQRSAYDLGRGIPSVLSHISSPVLSTITFQVHLNEGYLDFLWEDVAAALPAWLAAVEFSLWGAPPAAESALLAPYDEAVLVLTDRLSGLARKGLLRFRHADETMRAAVVAPSPVAEDPPRTLRSRLSRRLSGWIGRSVYVFVSL